MIRKTTAILILCAATTVGWFAWAETNAAQTTSATVAASRIEGGASVQDITNRFAKASIPIEAVRLDTFATNHFICAAYPYSGNNAIEVYVFVKWGRDWTLQMQYSCLNPTSRNVFARETAEEIVVYSRTQEYFKVVVDKTLNER